MPFMLTRLKLDEISLVDRGANPGAKILLTKRDEAEKDLTGGTRGDLSDSDFAAVWTDAQGNKQRKLPIDDAAHVRNALARFDQTDMPADEKPKARARLDAAARRFGIGDQSQKKEKSMDDLEKLQADLKAEKEARATAEAEIAKLKERKTAAGAGAAEAHDLVEKARRENEEARAEVEKLVKQAQDEAKEAREELLKLTEARRVEEFTKRADALKFLPGIAAKSFGPLLKEISEKAPDAYKKLETLLKTWNDAIEAGGLFGEIGAAGGGEAGSTAERIEALVVAKIEKSAGKVDRATAMGLVFKENPGLYREYRKEAEVRI